MKRKFRWQVVVFTIIRLVLNTVFRMVYPFRGEFEKGLGVSYAQMSRGLGIRSFLGLFSPLLALVGERRGRKTGILFGLAIYVHRSWGCDRLADIPRIYFCFGHYCFGKVHL